MAPSAARPVLRLGLIGDNIAASRAPRLHALAGDLLDRPTRYDRLVPAALGLDFDGVFDRAAAEGYRGLNITYPYKERAAARVTVDDPMLRRLGAVNTVVFEADGPKGFNTDYTGFVAAYRARFGAQAPGAVCMIGAGGVGRAVAYGLLALGAAAITLVERDLPKAQALGEELRAAAPALAVRATDDVAAGAAGASGLVNCTPVGMVGYPGTPLPRALMAGAAWAFDAVYTPVETQFLRDAAAAGAAALSGYELFFYQGLHCVEIFHGTGLDAATLRAALAADDPAAG
jgi:shikimate dehydrogenase